MPYRPHPTGSYRRIGAALAVVLLHACMFLALRNGIGRERATSVRAPLQVNIVSEDLLPREAAPPPPFHVETPQPYVPEPEIVVDTAPSPITTIGSVLGKSAPLELPRTGLGPATPPGLRTAPRLDPSRSPRSSAYYPAASQRLNEEGAAIVEVCIGTDGKVIGPAKLQTPSSSDRLNQAALRFAVNTRWIAATEDGQPVPSCTALSVRFVLERQLARQR